MEHSDLLFALISIEEVGYAEAIWYDNWIRN